jgi:nucleoid-associated protein YgaU
MIAGRTYVVVKGDSLSKIAKREYGDWNKWPKIYEANRNIIKKPDLIYPGQQLRIPEA